MHSFSINQPYKPFHVVPKNNKGQRYVITDIHGFYKTFQALLTQIQLTKEDQLFFIR